MSFELMFEHAKDVALPTGSIGPWPNNMAVAYLDTRNLTYMALISGHNVLVANWDAKHDLMLQWDIIESKDPTSDRKIDVTCVGLVHPNARAFPLLIIGTAHSVQIYDVRKNTGKILMQVNLENALKLSLDINRDIGPYCRGITCNDNTILVGTHSGDILIIMCNGESSFSTKKNLREHVDPISDIATCRFDEVTVSATNTGEIVVWQKPVKGVQARINSKQHITCLNVLRKQVIIGTVRGLVQLYAILTGELMCEINAHARPVTSISVAPESAYMMTCGEDSRFQVYKLHTRKPQAYQVEFRFSEGKEHSPYVGAQFANGRGSCIAVAAFDHTHISFYKIARKKEQTAETPDDI